MSQPLQATNSRGYFSSPRTLTRTAQKLQERGFLDADGARSVEHCIKIFHDDVNDVVVKALQPHLPTTVEGAQEEQHAVRELATIVSKSLANYAKAASEIDQQKAAETIQSALRRRREMKEMEEAVIAATDPLESRSDGASSRKTVVFSRLSPTEKEKFMKFLVCNRVAFTREGDEFVASIRLIPRKSSVPPNMHDESSIQEAEPPLAKSRFEEALFGKRAARPPQDQARIVRAMAKNAPNFDFDFSDYPKFTALISQDSHKQRARIRPLPWLLRLIEEIYESRIVFDRQRIRADQEGDGTGTEGDDRLSVAFPVFVIDFFSRKYGVRGLVDQNALDLLQSVHQFRESFLEVELFARFLETFYTPQDLLFFHYIRSILEKHLGKAYFSKRWNDLGPSREKLHESTWVPHQLSVQVCRLAFGDDKDSRKICNECLQLVHKYSEPIGSGAQAPKRIRVVHLLQLMLDQYHRTCPAPAAVDVDSLIFGDSQTSQSSSKRIQSKEEQDRLFREAERHYEEFSKSRNTNASNTSKVQSEQEEAAAGSGSASYVQRAKEERQVRIKVMEDRIRSEIALRRQNGTPNRNSAQQQDASQSKTSLDHNEESVRDASSASGEQKEAYGNGSTASLLQEIEQTVRHHDNTDVDGDLSAMLDLLGQYLQYACNAEMSRIANKFRASMQGIPSAFVDMVNDETTQKLQQKVEDVVKKLIDGTPDLNRDIVESFENMELVFNSKDDSHEQMENFCNDFMTSVRPQLEELYAGLAATVRDHASKTHLNSNGNNNDNNNGNTDRVVKRSPQKIHVSRRGSIDIQLAQ